MLIFRHYFAIRLFDAAMPCLFAAMHAIIISILRVTLRFSLLFIATCFRCLIFRQRCHTVVRYADVFRCYMLLLFSLFRHIMLIARATLLFYYYMFIQRVSLLRYCLMICRHYYAYCHAVTHATPSPDILLRDTMLPPYFAMICCRYARALTLFITVLAIFRYDAAEIHAMLERCCRHYFSLFRLCRCYIFRCFR